MHNLKRMRIPVLLILSFDVLLEASGYKLDPNRFGNVSNYLNNYIVGGSFSDIAKNPHQISLRYKSFVLPQDPYIHTCGGSILRSDIILTAAHCMNGYINNDYKVVAGTNNVFGSDGTMAPIEDILVHPDFSLRTFHADIALIKLSVHLPLNTLTIRAIELTETAPMHGTISVVSGWGLTTEGGRPSDTLQDVNVPIISKDVCNQFYDGEIFDSMICAGLINIGGKDACQGDSGGPLVIEGKLAGIVSWGYGCAEPEYPGVYTNVAYFKDWIDRSIAQWN